MNAFLIEAQIQAIKAEGVLAVNKEDIDWAHQPTRD